MRVANLDLSLDHESGTGPVLVAPSSTASTRAFATRPSRTAIAAESRTRTAENCVRENAGGEKIGLDDGIFRRSFENQID